MSDDVVVHLIDEVCRTVRVVGIWMVVGYILTGGFVATLLGGDTKNNKEVK